ncbi:hypothetical protein [Psychroserpens mesophilus]|uniref:DUF7793 family protein n=1 Tax=Psychroserpens mesophilus TaxID=325473 RepID=UPI003D64B6A5
MIENFIKKGTTTFWLDSCGIRNYRLDNKTPNYKLKQSISKQYVNAIKKLYQEKPMPFLIDLRGTRGAFPKKAVKVFAQSALLKGMRIPEAFVYDSIKIKLLIKSYKRIYNHFTPYQIFIDIQLAIDYCIVTRNEFYGSN